MDMTLPEHPEPIAGRATLTGTESYSERFSELDPAHFRLCHGLVYSSIGIGTYLGDATDEVDASYSQSIVRALASGCNVIDSAINYRFQRSEKSVGRALRQAIDKGFSREEIVVCTKGGYIPFEDTYPADPYQWVDDNLLRKRIITPEDIHPSGHCMAPMYLHHQVEQSLRNLQVDTIDVYYVHNPETQMNELNEPRFYEAVEMAFRMLENIVREGRIGLYGIATWDGFFESRGSGVLQLERLVEIARRAGGDQHHFRMLQMPINLAMTDSMGTPNQKLGDRKLTVLEAARAHNICVVGSASLLQQNLARGLPVTLQQAIPGLPNDAARALQFARSVPGVTTALVGMSSPEHVLENLELAAVPPMSEVEFNILFGER
jgi:aryl-alcohol dehydrogenase-like predicted oxidoreductase